MANGRMNLSIDGEDKLIRIMSQLELNEKRPEALRMAFVKGMVTNDQPSEKQDRKTRFVIPDSVIARGEEYLLYKHLIVEKVGKQLDAKGIDDFMLRCIEDGLEIMNDEINSLSALDNYLLFLVDKHG